VRLRIRNIEDTGGTPAPAGSGNPIAVIKHNEKLVAVTAFHNSPDGSE